MSAPLWAAGGSLRVVLRSFGGSSGRELNRLELEGEQHPAEREDDRRDGEPELAALPELAFISWAHAVFMASFKHGRCQES